MNIIEKLAQEFSVRIAQVENTVQLIDDGNTIPFIARYRKEVTGGLSDVTLRDMDERLTYLRNLENRKEEVIRLIDEQGKLTEELQAEIEKAEVLQRVEDLYKPYKQKKSTRASKAKEKGLEPLALLFYAQEIESGNMDELAAPYINAEKGVENTEQAIQGAMDIIAEMIADHPELTAMVREKTQKSGLIVTEAADPEEKTVYDMYYGHQEGILKIPNHRVLAINRGEKEKKLKVKVSVPVEELQMMLEEAVITNEKSIFMEPLKDTIADAYKRLMAPSIEREMRNLLTERAELDAVKVFAKNTEKLLMVPPMNGARIISIDPGYRTGCKVAVLNETGKLLAYTTVYPTEPKKDIAGTEAVLKKLVEKFKINTIVIGNGTASRETEEVVADFLKKNEYDISYTIVNEAGASVYSASKLATEEYPDLDVTTRGAMSLGRRLQDPLAELVKISPKSIGVGQYQHDIDQNLLDGALTNVVEDCVNRVGVDLNTASPSLLSYIAGINMGIAKNIVAYREEAGKFTNRKELLKVSKLGEKTYKQCAGFMRIADGTNPLDATSVHPESYGAADIVLQKLTIDKEQIRQGGVKDIEEKICETYPTVKKTVKVEPGTKGLAALAVLKEPKKEDPKRGLGKSIEKLAEEVGIGAMTLKDIIEEIKKPARDPREDAPAVVFRNDVRSFEDLKVGMEMMGTVRNVVDFGAFVDIGVKNDGLVHISEISNKFIKHPMDVVSVGDTVKVKILSVDYERQKIALTMKL
ncbi:Tex family protein [Aminipila luticellarii]|uniref:RNA-binding transcriptional accessory protein n=1 Tax=Aminipila luticellarii TaxID=2507160 RepID=A0A410PY36_9FIRM|nr:Tex family protein [Aminipila luticellarii]QAT43805.1 RNA-binding transcriptional accessory protein [Aminipila luticellarii]